MAKGHSHLPQGAIRCEVRSVRSRCCRLQRTELRWKQQFLEEALCSYSRATRKSMALVAGASPVSSHFPIVTVHDNRRPNSTRLVGEYSFAIGRMLDLNSRGKLRYSANSRF